jgi:hypothetical protein
VVRRGRFARPVRATRPPTPRPARRGPRVPPARRRAVGRGRRAAHGRSGVHGDDQVASGRRAGDSNSTYFGENEGGFTLSAQRRLLDLAARAARRLSVRVTTASVVWTAMASQRSKETGPLVVGEVPRGQAPGLPSRPGSAGIHTRTLGASVRVGGSTPPDNTRLTCCSRVLRGVAFPCNCRQLLRITIVNPRRTWTRQGGDVRNKRTVFTLGIKPRGTRPVPPVESRREASRERYKYDRR